MVITDKIFDGFMKFQCRVKRLSGDVLKLDKVIGRELSFDLRTKIIHTKHMPGDEDTASFS
jgi:hypothetical protein